MIDTRHAGLSFTSDLAAIHSMIIGIVVEKEQAMSSQELLLHVQYTETDKEDVYSPMTVEQLRFQMKRVPLLFTLSSKFKDSSNSLNIESRLTSFAAVVQYLVIAEVNFYIDFIRSDNVIIPEIAIVNQQNKTYTIKLEPIEPN